MNSNHNSNYQKTATNKAVITLTSATPLTFPVSTPDAAPAATTS